MEPVGAGSQSREVRDRVLSRARQHENSRLNKAVIVPAVVKTRELE